MPIFKMVFQFLCEKPHPSLLDFQIPANQGFQKRYYCTIDALMGLDLNEFRINATRYLINIDTILDKCLSMVYTCAIPHLKALTSWDLVA